MKGTTKLAIGAAVGLAALGGVALAMGSSKSASAGGGGSGGGGNPAPPPLPPVAGSITVTQGQPYSLRIFQTNMTQGPLTNALNGLGFTTGFTLSQNSDGTWDLGGTWTGASATIQAQQTGFAFDPTF